MQFQTIPDQPDIVMWMTEQGSGIAREGDPQWNDFQQFLAKGGELMQLAEAHLSLSMAMAMIVTEAERVCSTLRAGYPLQESESWSVQAAEAQAWLVNPAISTPLIDALLLPYEDKAALCQQIAAHYAAYTKAMGEIIMWRRIATAAIEAYFASGRPIMALVVQYPEVPYAS